MPLLSRFKEPTGKSKMQLIDEFETLSGKRDEMQEKLDEMNDVLDEMKDELNHM